MITGTITVKPEAGFDGPILEPIFIGEYDTASQDTFDYQLLVIVTIGITTILVVLFLVFVVTRRINLFTGAQRRFA